MNSESEAQSRPEELAEEMWRIHLAQPALVSLDVDEMRRHAIVSKRPWNEGATDGLLVTDGTFPTRSDQRPIRELSPPNAPTDPVVHIHGGGWVTCDADTHLSVLAQLARASRRPVLAPHARRAPESPYPAALDDTVDALRYAGQRHAGGFFLSGDSAGANLALAALLWLRDHGEAVPVRSVALAYGCYRRRFDTRSHNRYGDGCYGLTTTKMRLFWDLYLSGSEHAAYADLEHASMHGLPPIQIHAAGADILLDDSIWLSDRIKQADGQAELTVWDGMAHGFLHYPADLASARDASAKIALFFDGPS